MLSEKRIAAIRAHQPSEAALERAYANGARDLQSALEWVWNSRIATAERHDRGEHYGAANYSRRILRDTPGATAHEEQAARRAKQNQEAERFAALDRAIAKQPHAFADPASFHSQKRA